MTADQEKPAKTKQSPSRLTVLAALIVGIWIVAAAALIGTSMVLPDDLLRAQFEGLLKGTIGGATIATVVIVVFL